MACWYVVGVEVDAIHGAEMGCVQCVMCSVSWSCRAAVRYTLLTFFLFSCMQPLHYACAYGAPEEILYVLTDTYPEAITTKDINERTPLHFALSNAGRRAAPSAVRLLLSLNRDIVNSIDEGPLPLRVLAGYAATVKDDDETRDSVHRCLEHLLNAEPDPTADFLTALQSLPDWLSERAVVVPIVQNLLNEKISQRFPTAVLMLDFYVLTMIIISYSMNFVDSIRKRTDEDKDNNAIDFVNLIPLYLGAAYFTLREVIQMISLLSLKYWRCDFFDNFVVEASRLPSKHAYRLCCLCWRIGIRRSTSCGLLDGLDNHLDCLCANVLHHFPADGVLQ
jgi:hypothetical protein